MFTSVNWLRAEGTKIHILLALKAAEEYQHHMGERTPKTEMEQYRQRLVPALALGFSPLK